MSEVSNDDQRTRAYPEQVSGPVGNTLPCGSIGRERASAGTREGASLSKTLESLIDGLDTMTPVEVGRLIGMGDGVLNTIQDDPAHTSREH